MTDIAGLKLMMGDFVIVAHEKGQLCIGIVKESTEEGANVIVVPDEVTIIYQTYIDPVSLLYTRLNIFQNSNYKERLYQLQHQVIKAIL